MGWELIYIWSFNHVCKFTFCLYIVKLLISLYQVMYWYFILLLLHTHMAVLSQVMMDLFISFLLQSGAAYFCSNSHQIHVIYTEKKSVIWYT